jgi:hypothetical protein
VRRNRSRLALLGVLALALSVTVGPAVADAKRVTSTETGGVVPDAVLIPGGGPLVDGAAVPVEFDIKGNKVKNRQIADVDIQISVAATAEGAAGDLRYKLVSPNGDSVNWGIPPIGFTSFDVKWDNKSQLGACNPLFLQASDCLYVAGNTAANEGIGSLIGDLDGGFLRTVFRTGNPRGDWTLYTWDTDPGGITTLGNVSLTVNAVKKYAKE